MPLFCLSQGCLVVRLLVKGRDSNQSTQKAMRLIPTGLARVHESSRTSCPQLEGAVLCTS